MKIGISFTKSKTNTLETLKLINQTDADYLHIDTFDGTFVPPTQQLPSQLATLLPHVTKPLDVHVLVSDPISYLDFFTKYNPVYFTFPYEAVKNIEKTILIVREKGFKVGISINPETKVEVLIPYLNNIDQIIIMTCTPGYGGTPFQESGIAKISFLKELKDKNNYQFLISADGGINNQTIDKVKKAGVDIVVSGSYICMSDDYQAAINQLR